MRLEETVAEAGRAGLYHNKTVRSAYPIGWHEETVPSSYQVSRVIVYYIFYFKVIYVNNFLYYDAIYLFINYVVIQLTVSVELEFYVN